MFGDMLGIHFGINFGFGILFGAVILKGMFGDMLGIGLVYFGDDLGVNSESLWVPRGQPWNNSGDQFGLFWGSLWD